MSLLIAFDTETTGTDTSKNEVIEMSAVVLDPVSFMPTKEIFNRKMNVERPDTVSQGVLGNFNHYNPEVWAREATSQVQGWSDFCDWVYRVGGNGVQRGILVGHNVIGFDYPMVRTWTQYFMLKANLSYHQEDTMYQYIMATQMLGESVGKCNLAEVAGFWGVGFEKAKSHGAAYDAMASGLCYAIGRHYIKTIVECGIHPHAVLLNEAWRRIGQRPTSMPLPKR